MAKNKILVNVTGVTVFLILSKLLGFARDVLIGSTFGTTSLADIYLGVFAVASLLFTSIAMALSSVNIPNLTYYISNKNEEERKKYVSNLYSHVLFFGTIISVLGIIFSPLIAKIILPGYSDEMASVAVALTRIMMPTLLFISLAYVTAGILQVHRHFFMSTVISIPFNILIIGSLIIWKDNIMVLGWVTTLGWLLQFAIQLPVLFKEKYKIKFNLSFKNTHIKTVYKQLLPILLGNAVLQICLITDRAFGTKLDEGTAAALAYGSNLFMVITSVFVVAMSTVIFPDLSKYCIERNYEKIRGILSYIFRILLFIFLPYLIIVSMYSRDIIKIIYERGSFTPESTTITSTAFLLYNFCLAGYVCQEIFNRLYYALKKFTIPMFLSLSTIVINFVMASLLYTKHGIVGLSGSTAIAFLIYAIAMSVMVRREVGSFLEPGFGLCAAKLVFCALVMISVFWVFKVFNPDGIIKSFILPLLIGGGFYILAAYFTGTFKDAFLKGDGNSE